MATVVVADDAALLRHGVRLIRERDGFDVVAEAAHGNEAVQASIALCPDLVVLNVFMPYLNGIDSARQIHRVVPEAKRLLISAAKRPISVDEIVGAGIRGFIPKRMTSEVLVRSAHDVLRGAVVWTGCGRTGVSMTQPARTRSSATCCSRLEHQGDCRASGGQHQDH
jgi:two-component system response regulator DesR